MNNANESRFLATPTQQAVHTLISIDGHYMQTHVSDLGFTRVFASISQCVRPLPYMSGVVGRV